MHLFSKHSLRRQTLSYLLLAGATFFWAELLPAQQDSSSKGTGSIKGRVVDLETRQALPGVSVQIPDTKIGAVSNPKGEFTIKGLAAGSYQLQFRSLGYAERRKTDVIVRPGRITFVEAALQQSALESEGVTVQSSYFQKRSQALISVAEFNNEEIRRAPGSGGDVNRIINALPSVVQISDERNDLLVRGGSAAENGYYIDNIFIPNINHFPESGSGGGAISVLNIDFIRDLSFSAGGFSAAYGDKLSAIMEISFREGNREEFDGQLDLNITGFGGIFEGPLPGGEGSWLVSAKRSYIDLIADAIGTDEAPRFGDAHAKITYDLDSDNSLSLLNVFGDNSVERTRERAIEEGRSTYFRETAHLNTTGMTWRRLWGGSGYSKTSLSYSFAQQNDIDWSVNGSRAFNDDSFFERSIVFRNVNFLQADDAHKFEFGVEVKRDESEFRDLQRQRNEQGQTIFVRIVNEADATRSGAFLSYIVNPLPSVTATLGLRGDYYSGSERFLLSPRFAASWQVAPEFSINAASGVYHQRLPYYLLSENPELAALRDPMALHFILGFDYYIGDDSKLTLELYDKEYRNFPMSPEAPNIFLGDSENPGFNQPITFQDNGKAYARGIELMLQKKLAQDFHGIVSASFFRSRYEDLDGVTRNRMFDNRYLFSLIGGYKASEVWEFSVRFNLSGGRAYTPFDLQASIESGSGIRDFSRVNSEYIPPYHSLNLRADRRIFFDNASLVLFASIWNIYNRSNVLEYEFEPALDEIVPEHQFSLLPIIGVEFEF